MTSAPGRIREAVVSSMVFLLKTCKCLSVFTLRVFVPNVFTPDQDGVNEVWMPVVVGAVEYEVQVFNRWGQRVFHSNTPGEPWLGEVNGGEYFSPNGVYVWTLKVTAEDLEVHESTGHVILMR